MRSKSNKKILIIDDDKEFLQVIGHMLRALGHELVFARSANEGIFKVHQMMHQGVPLPDLILFDQNMPAVSGFDFISRYNEICPEHKIPSLLISAEPDFKQMIKARRMGVLGCLHKPIQKRIALQRLVDALVG